MSRSILSLTVETFSRNLTGKLLLNDKESQDLGLGKRKGNVRMRLEDSGYYVFFHCVQEVSANLILMHGADTYTCWCKVLNFFST